MDNVNGGGDRNNNWVGNRAKDWNRAKDKDWKRNNRDNTWDKDSNVSLEAGNSNWRFLCYNINEAPWLQFVKGHKYMFV